ncbi:arabinogalactan endo-1,4-beta-galactosidase [Vibrio cincinnatiensis]|uniref:Arabinogalactan endo-beta-1,4-galactanase n=1 Tax=Vibrio cincinnatiensis DSM 19608 TaxID=1123491 RepID=A0A1T4MGM9_VIBCI|nr:glycosyl hydrolase 53 family protein [Vibrio cincinnatiensis]MCG3721583.1 arabinogalactan endo-1,4-beta-galactosidase [Vibrio cincinnatiensis]MCG3746278.1 arabinogalactan endo-1,4-beta-galactosidase [Vibrio cincinnatiensis]MCG3765822.1 arabinogalactan endo-1,4-beta-galactosidase [Vibrio cincinnatiensis]SJZ66179.1 arabinogalactan endo-1,4-beta-galactosidase [Vibrio cincinnatiensis DSM 19608]SUP47976.1 arabinogalactan endo-1,4-beta-galactosidase [Vibrio cincinnatiensis]
MQIIPNTLASLSLLLFAHSSFAFTKGADISWLTQMENSGYQFYNDWGYRQDVLSILRDHGMTAVRLRVWVNPADGYYNSLDDVIVKAQWAKAAGMDVMIDFHYSDTWADPGNQWKPNEWKNLNFNELMGQVWSYTRDSLTELKNAGITPKWIQIGNETNNGMLWNDGLASNNMRNFAWLFNSGRNAAKEVFPQAKIIVHLANCHDNANFRWIFDGLKANGSEWDVIGASSYPRSATGLTWQQATNLCRNNLNDMVSRYGSEVMVTEVGVPWDDPEAKAILSDVISKVRSVNQGKGIGVFYWEPQAYSWQGYTWGAWDPNTQRPTEALDAFLE